MLEPVLDVSLARAFASLGIDLSDLSSSYSLATWTAALQLAMDTLYPVLPPEEAAFQLGNQFIHSYATTLVGKILAASSRVIGPRRALKATARNLRTGNNYSRVQVTELSPQSLDILINIAPFPTYFAGMFYGGLTLSGGRDAEVRFIGHDEHGFRYFAHWS